MTAPMPTMAAFPHQSPVTVADPNAGLWGQESAAEMLTPNQGTMMHPTAPPNPQQPGYAGAMNPAMASPHQGEYPGYAGASPQGPGTPPVLHEVPMGPAGAIPHPGMVPPATPGATPPNVMPNTYSQPAPQPSPEQQALAQVESIGGMSPQELQANHPELYQSWLNMQQDYTRKTQAVADERRELNSTRGELEELRNAADSWRNLQSVPGLTDHIRDYVTGITGGAPVNGNGGNAATHQPAVDIPIVIDHESGQIDTQALGAVIDQRAAQIAQSQMNGLVQQQILPAFQNLFEREKERTVSQLREKHPDFTQLEPQVEALRQSKPHLSYEDAYRILAHDTQYARGQQSALAAVTRKKMVAQQTAPMTTSPAMVHVGGAPVPAISAPLNPADPLGDALDRSWQALGLG